MPDRLAEPPTGPAPTADPARPARPALGWRPAARRRAPGPDAVTVWLVGLLVAAVWSHVGATEAETLDVQLLAIIGLAGMAAVALARRGVGQRIPAGLGAVVVYGAVVAASVIWAVDRAVALDGLASVGKAMIVTVALALLVDDARTLRAAVWGVIVAGGAIAAVSLAGLVFGLEVEGVTSAEEHGLLTADVVRIGGPVGDPNFFSQLLVVVVALAVERARNATAGGARVVAGTVALVSSGAIVASWSRGGVLALIVVLVLALPRIRPRVLLGGVAVAAVVLALGPNAYVERLAASADAIPGVGSGTPEDGAVRGRTSEVLVGLQQFSDHPISGVGIGNYEVLYLDYAVGVGLESRREDRSAHSTPVEVGAETGILGLLAWTAVVAAALLAVQAAAAAARSDGRVRDAALARGIGVALVGHLVTALFLHTAYPRGFWLLIGLAVAAPVALRSRAR